MSQEQLCGLNFKHVRKLANDLKSDVGRTCFQLAQVCAVYTCRMSQVFLRKPLGMAMAP